MLINQARFKVNGNTGYVLKPDYLRGNVKFDPSDTKTFPRSKPVSYRIKVKFGEKLRKKYNRQAILTFTLSERVHELFLV